MATSVVAFEFFFNAEEMKKLVDTNPNKIMCVVRIDEEVTKDNRKVGALKITATGIFKSATEGTTEGDMIIDGCPHPPCER